MSDNYEKLFSLLEPSEPSAGLFDKVMSRIQNEKRLVKIRRRLIVFSIGLLGSMAAFIPVFMTVKAGLIESGFTTFLSLLFSDTSIVLTYWKNFTLSLLETLPVINLALLAAILLTFLESLKFVARDAKTLFFPKIINNI